MAGIAISLKWSFSGWTVLKAEYSPKILNTGESKHEATLEETFVHLDWNISKTYPLTYGIGSKQAKAALKSLLKIAFGINDLTFFDALMK
jgi:hypothetical protein